MEMEEDDSVDTRERWYRWMTEAAVHERRQARTDWLAVNREGTIVGRALQWLHSTRSPRSKVVRNTWGSR